MRLALIVATVALLAPGTAAASTAAVTEHQDRVSYAALSYVAADGEANDLLVQGDAQSIVLTDPGAEIDPGPGCTPSGDHSVTCTTELSFNSAYEPLEARLGDEEDAFTSQGPFFRVYGGPGEDALDGGTAGGTFFGGDGDDTLAGGTRRVYLDGGVGADTMTGSDEADLFVGGPGPDTMDARGQVAAFALGDTISYRSRRARVTIDLSTPGSAAGAEGEGDTISNFENAYGGAGSDTITARQDVWHPRRGSVVSASGGDDAIEGGLGYDELHGEAGDDTIRGEAGNDYMTGGTGGDTVLGEAGRNTLLGVGGAGDLADCGEAGRVWPGVPGKRLLGAIDQSCRRVRFEYVPITHLRYSYDGNPTRAVTTNLLCKRRCLVTVALRAGGKLLGKATRSIRRDQRGVLTVPLGDEARAALAEAGVLRVRFSMDVKWGPRLAERQVTSWGLLLHHPPAAR